MLCYYGFGACEILADAPADCKFHFLFAFLLNQAPSVSLQDHIQGVIPSPFRKPQIHFPLLSPLLLTPRQGSGPSGLAWRRSRARMEEEQGSGVKCICGFLKGEGITP